MDREELTEFIWMLKKQAELHDPNEEILTDVKAESFIFVMDEILSELSDEWLTSYLEHQLEVLEQDISEQRMFGNNYLIGKRAAYNDIYKMLRGDK